VSDLKQYIGGVTDWFNDVEAPIYNIYIGSGGQMQWFGQREAQFDGSWNANGAHETRYEALKAGYS